MRVFKIYAVILFFVLLLVPYSATRIKFPVKDELIENNSEFSEIKIYRTSTDTVETISCYDYLCASLCGEMQANYEIEALKAQAVACYTYMLGRANYVLENPDIDVGHKGAFVCDDSSHCMAYLDKESAKNKWGNSFYDKYYDNIVKAVSEVIGEVIIYEETPINAVFHSVSAGTTFSAKDVWGSDVPYLLSVDSSLDKNAADFETKEIFTKNDFKNIFYDELGVTLSDSASLWFGETEKTSSGMVKHITVADTIYSGTYIRKIFGLRSSAFDVKLVDDNVVFTVYGYGHGVGMSQNGANELAKQGKNYKEILSHYYTGIEIGYQKF